MRRIGTSAALLVLAGCTFAGVADYDVEGCDPSQLLADSPCNRLNDGNTSCHRYQCDKSSRACVLSLLDADGDGDAPIACGGTDCDDGNALRSGKQTEICDGIDNDCDGIVDDGLLVPSAMTTSIASLADHRLVNPDFRLASSNGTSTYATYLAQDAGCVRGIELGAADTDAGSGCTTVTDGGADASTDIREPELDPVGAATEGNTGVAFVLGPDTECASDHLAYYSRAAGHSVLADCGAVLPAMASFPLQSQAAVIAFFDGNVSDHDKPIDDCAALPATPLRLRWIDQPARDDANASTNPAALGNARSVRPPALVAVANGTSVLLASPVEDDAGLWSLTADGRVIPLASRIPALAGARSTAMAIGTDGTTTRLAIVAEQGCRPNQGLAMVIGVIDPLTASFVGTAGAAALSPVTVAAIPSPAISAPAVAWMASRNEWWVTWVDQRQKAMLRRVAPDGATPEPPLELGDAQLAMPAATGTTTGSAASPSAYLLRPDGSAVDRVALSCK